MKSNALDVAFHAKAREGLVILELKNQDKSKQLPGTLVTRRSHTKGLLRSSACVRNLSKVELSIAPLSTSASVISTA